MGPFNRWCSENNITHELSSPYNPRGNGLAEAAVKNIKALLAKCAETKTDAQKALYHWRNIPRSDGYSPAQLLFGRKQFTALPAEDSHYTFYDPATAQQRKDKTFQRAGHYFDEHKAFLPPLQIGDKVILQDPHTLLWTVQGEILETRPDQLSYKVAVGNRIQVRARRMLKALPEQLQQANAHLTNAQHPELTKTASNPQSTSTSQAVNNNPSSDNQRSRWDRGSAKKRQKSRTARQSCSPPTAHSSSSTGPPLAPAYQASQSSWSSSSCWPSATKRTSALTEEPDVPSCTTFYTPCTEEARQVQLQPLPGGDTHNSPLPSRAPTPGYQCQWQPWRPWSPTPDNKAHQQPSFPPARCSNGPPHTAPTPLPAGQASPASTAASTGESASGPTTDPWQPDNNPRPRRPPSPCPPRQDSALPGNRRTPLTGQAPARSRPSHMSPTPSQSPEHRSRGSSRSTPEKSPSTPSAKPNPWLTSSLAPSPLTPSPGSTGRAQSTRPSKKIKKDSNVFKKIFYMNSF